MNTLSRLTPVKPAHQLTAAIFVAVFFIVASKPVFAQATVRDSSPINGQAAVAAPGSASGQAQSSNFQLINQLQQLQQEVQELRGLVEEQNFEIKRLKQQRLDDYLDLDKRIGELREQQQQAASQPARQNPVNSLSASSTAAIGATAAPVDPEAEKGLYRQAIDQLLNQQDYAGAQASFKQYLKDYPAGTFAPNVHYWQGQIYITDSNKEAAEKSFLTLVNDYPNHQKTPDAKYKLATLYFDKGQKSEAKALLDEVAASDSDASRLAKAFLAKQYP